ncbi:MAG: NUDIX domain-containing protein [Methylobacteriaceae bacterium]|nr:NUDIX domain-containing protein [Methylobacteriaceae bacterium]
MPRLRSAGILMYRRTGAVEVLLAHPGGPFWRGKDLGAWSIPKGVCDATEAPEAAAVREFEEELGVRPVGSLLPLGEAVQAGGKVVTAFALEGDLDCSQIRSNEFEIEWPPKSGRRASFPEVDRAEWFALDAARDKIVRGQAVFLDRLAAALAPDPR